MAELDNRSIEQKINTSAPVMRYINRGSRKMHKIAIVDDDEYWCLALQRWLRNSFEVHSFKRISTFLQDLEEREYDLVIMDFSIPPANYEKDIDSCELIRHLKASLPEPPVMVLATGFVSKNNPEIGKEICPEADAFFAKDAGLEAIISQTEKLLAARKILHSA